MFQERSDFFDSRQLKGAIFSIFVIAIAVAEAAIGWRYPFPWKDK